MSVIMKGNTHSVTLHISFAL